MSFSNHLRNFSQLLNVKWKQIQYLIIYSSASTLLFVMIFHVVNVRHLVNNHLDFYLQRSLSEIQNENKIKEDEPYIIQQSLNFFNYRSYLQAKDKYDEQLQNCVETSLKVYHFSLMSLCFCMIVIYVLSVSIYMQ